MELCYLFDALTVSKANIVQSWGAAAEGYVKQFLDRSDDDDTRMDMAAGRKLVVSRVVSVMSDKVYMHR